MNVAELPVPVQSFWSRYLSGAGLDPETPIYDVDFFADNEQDANELLELVMNGTKRGTAALLWEYEAEGKRLPQPGDLSIVTDWDGSPHCVIETTRVDIRAYQDVDQEFAAIEGEGDHSLEFWRNAHWPYFGRRCAELGLERSDEMPVVCEQFRRVYP